MATDTQRIIAR